MLNFNLNAFDSSAFSGGVNATSGGGLLLGGIKTISNFNDNPLAAVTSALSPIPIIGDIANTVGGLLSSVGVGPDSWADVESRTLAEIKTIIDYGANKYLQGANQSNIAQKLSDYDMYIVSDAQYRKDISKRQSAQNSKQRSQLMYQKLTEHIQGMRQSMSKGFDIKIETKRVQASGVTSYKNVVFDHSFIQPVQAATYVANTAKEEALQQAVKPSNALPTSDNYPADSADNSTEKDGNLLIAGVVGFITILIFGIVYLVKKKKK